VTEKFSHIYKTTGIIVVRYVLIVTAVRKYVLLKTFVGLRRKYITYCRRICENSTTVYLELNLCMFVELLPSLRSLTCSVGGSRYQPVTEIGLTAGEGPRSSAGKWTNALPCTGVNVACSWKYSQELLS
jgi:hypothetical protein